jgi:hypothetical protein
LATSQYFNYFRQNQTEQNLFEDLVEESIQLMGADAMYLPNTNDQARDLLYGEDPLKSFSASYPIEIYMSSVMQYGGDGDFFSKFGLQIRNTITVIVSKRAFSKRIPQNQFQRPREGDLIYVPFTNGEGELFEITYVNQNKDFFTLGRKIPFYYELELEKFKYSQENISTGIPDIDGIVPDDAYTINLNLGSGTGNFINQEIVFQSSDSTIENAYMTALCTGWDAVNKVITISNIFGEPSNTVNIIGSTSNAVFSIATFNELENVSVKESYDNKTISTEASTVVVTSETNPLGSLGQGNALVK